MVDALSIDHWIDDSGHMAPEYLICMVDSLASAAYEHIRKNRNKLLGDLGIEPRSQWIPVSASTTTPCACICYYDNKQI